ncbi:MAG TPA: hypothetical protein VF201_09960 [Nitrolancea sp.]
MDESIEPIVEWFRSQGFRIVYVTSAVCLLAHAELPGVEARIGTVYSVVERDGEEIYRMAHRDFDRAAAHERIFGGQP